MSSSSHTGYHLYRYDPSLALAIVFLALFGLTTIVHTYQLLRSQTFYLIPLIIGGLFEVVGYAGRIVSSQQSQKWTPTPYIMQSLLLLLAPALFAASICMHLGRIVRLVQGEKDCLIPLKWLSKIFVAGDVFSFLVQPSGGSLMAMNDGANAILGSRIMLAGLFVQLVLSGLFVLLAVTLGCKLNKRSSMQSPARWYSQILALCAVGVLIMARSIFRVAEYAQGADGFLLGHEYFLYIFDAVLMLTVMVVLNVIHPSLMKGSEEGEMYKLEMKQG